MTSGPETKISMHLKHNSLHSGPRDMRRNLLLEAKNLFLVFTQFSRRVVSTHAALSPHWRYIMPE